MDSNNQTSPSPSSSSFSHRMIRSSPISCFVGHRHTASSSSTFNDSDSDTSSIDESVKSSSLSTSSSSLGWLKSASPVKEKYANFISKLGRREKRRSTSNRTNKFSYDPQSYALNFDDGAAAMFEFDDEPLRNFSARLSTSLPEKKFSSGQRESESSKCVIPHEISACS